MSADPKTSHRVLDGWGNADVRPPESLSVAL